MFKKFMTAAAVSAIAVGAGAMAAAPAMAIGDDNGVNTLNGNGALQIYGTQMTHGDMSPQFGLAQGALNKPCIGLPAKLNAQSLIAPLNIGVQDVNALSSPQNQQCTENSTQAKGDEPLSHILDNIPVLSGNAAQSS